MSNATKLQPVKLLPAFKDYIWGGEKLKTLFHKHTDLFPLAESWELSCHPNGMSTIASGEWEGRSLKEYIDHYGKDILGSRGSQFEKFPLLIKLIDAKQNLSIQVHPDDEYALSHENQYGKTEMWYVVECDPGAYLYCGFSQEITKEELQERIRQDTLLEVLNKVPVQKGDLFFIPPGTIHAICAGTVIAEIQQNSDVTYRVYDYGRTDAQGNPRQLHIEQAVAVTNLAPPPEGFNQKGIRETKEGGAITPLKKCAFFDVSLLEISKSYTLETDTASFQSLLCLEDNCKLNWESASMEVTKGDSIFIPAGLPPVTISGTAELILSRLPGMDTPKALASRFSLEKEKLSKRNHTTANAVESFR